MAAINAARILAKIEFAALSGQIDGIGSLIYDLEMELERLHRRLCEADSFGVAVALPRFASPESKWATGRRA